MKSTNAYLPVPTHVRIIYFSVRATSICRRVFFSPIKPSLGQNCNLARGYIQSPIHGFSHPYSYFWRSIWLWLFPIPTTSFPYFLAPPWKSPQQTFSIFPLNLPCLCSKPSCYYSSLTTNPGPLYSWIDKCVTSHRWDLCTWRGAGFVIPKYASLA